MSTYVDDLMQEVTVVSPVLGCFGESHSAVEWAVTADDCDELSGADGDGKVCTCDTHTVRFTVFEGP